MNNHKLADWLIQQCEQRNLSWAEASRRAGVSPNTISQIVNGVPPGVKRLSALAEFFGVSNGYLFNLAGLLSEPLTPGNNHIPAEEQARIDHIIKVWREVAELDPGSLGVLLNIVEGQAEMAKALLEAGRRLVQEENNQTAKP